MKASAPTTDLSPTQDCGAKETPSPITASCSTMAAVFARTASPMHALELTTAIAPIVTPTPSLAEGSTTAVGWITLTSRWPRSPMRAHNFSRRAGLPITTTNPAEPAGSASAASRLPTGAPLMHCPQVRLVIVGQFETGPAATGARHVQHDSSVRACADHKQTHPHLRDAGAAAASARCIAAATSSICARVNSGNMGSESTSRATVSETGNDPSGYRSSR